MSTSSLRLQPKQAQVFDLVEKSQASWIGAGGGRGGAKSGGLQRIMLGRRTALPGTIGAILMRNYDQVKRYHVDVMLRDYPELAKYYRTTENKIVLPTGGTRKQPVNSEIHFTYAESLEDVIRRFRSANYYDVFVDQAEQFTEPELREIKQCVRWRGTAPGACKLVLAFNMGGAGIDFLRRKFKDGEFNEYESAEDFAFVQFYPWDNVEWCRPALEADGLTEVQYYREFTEEQRMHYCATRADYGKNLVAQDEPLRKRDWFGSWESLEGAYFGRVFDRGSVVLSPDQVSVLIKPWWKRWLSQDWGRGHYCTTHWHARGEISADDAKNVLGWEVTKPVRAVVTYREYIAGGAAESDEGGLRDLAEQDIARQIVERTPESERAYLSSFFLSPDAFAKRSSANTIAHEMGVILRAAKMPTPSAADNDRVGGWGLIYNLLLATKRHGLVDSDCWFISANCPEAERTIPLLMRDPANLDDEHKTDKGTAKLEQDIADDLRYGLKTMLSPNTKPKEVQRLELLTQPDLTPTQRYLLDKRFDKEWKQRTRPVVRLGNWRSRLEGL